MLAETTAADDFTDPVATALRRWWAISGLVLFAATWKLWTPQTEFPQVPLLCAAGAVPVSVEWLCFGIVLGTLVAAALNRWTRLSWLAFAAALFALILIDQHRLQQIGRAHV